MMDMGKRKNSDNKMSGVELTQAAMRRSAREQYVAALRDGAAFRASTIPMKKRAHQFDVRDLDRRTWD